MNKSKILVVGIFILSLAFVRCKKEINNQKENAQSEIKSGQSKFAINEAKSIFFSKLVFDSTFSNEAFLFKPSNVKKTINWDLAKALSNDKKFWVIEVPINFKTGVSATFGKDKSEAKNALRLPTVSKLVFLKDRTFGKIYTTIMTVVPTDKEVDQDDFHYGVLPAHFNGSVVYSNWNGTLHNSWYYENGEPTKEIKQKTKGANYDYVESFANPDENCNEYIIDTWERTCINYTDGTQECSDWYWIGSHNVTICNGGGGSGEYVTTSGTEEELVLMFDDKIDSSSLANCLDSVFSKVRRIDSGKFAKIVQDFSGDIPNFDWKVKSDFLNGMGDNATTAGMPINGFFVTTFNMTTLSGASDLCIARTMIHECIHAYLTYYFHYDVNTYNKTYMELIRQYRVDKLGSNLSNEQHYIMEQAFINDVIAPALKQFGDAMGYNLDFQYYKDLAWGGVDYNSNTQLSSADKIRIQGRLVQEQDGTGFGTKMCANYVEQ